MLLLPKLSKSLTARQMEVLAMRCGVSAVGSASSGKGSPAGPGGAWDVSFLSAVRMGKTEIESVQKLIEGVDALITIEKSIDAGDNIHLALGKNSNILDL